MGQAKRRGTYEERVAEGVARRQQEAAEREAARLAWRREHPESGKALRDLMTVAAIAAGSGGIGGI